MKLKEHEGKDIFRKYSIPVPCGFVVKKSEEIATKIGEMQDVVVKAQLLVGGRGKAGGIKFANKETVKDIADQVLGMTIKGLSVKEVLIEEKLKIDKEMYLSLTINRSERDITFIFSEEGGINIEELAVNNPDKVLKHGLSLGGLKEKLKAFTPEHHQYIKLIADVLYRMMKDLDCELIEINPLVISDGAYIAADSKVIIDDNAVFRHPEFAHEKKEQLTEIEQKASDYDLNYVELDGDIAIIGNGAGLVMATLDVVNHFGGKCANFLDVGGGASVEKMEQALEVVLMKQPKGILVNIFGGITRCDEIAKGLVNYIKNNGIALPMAVRMIGTNEEEGKRILKDAGIESMDSMEECAERIVELSK